MGWGWGLQYLILLQGFYILLMSLCGFFFQVRVVSPDKDFFQILSPSLRLLRIATRGSQSVSIIYYLYLFWYCMLHCICTFVILAQILYKESSLCWWILWNKHLITPLNLTQILISSINPQSRLSNFIVTFNIGEVSTCLIDKAKTF